MKYNSYFIASRGEGNNRQRVEEIQLLQKGSYNKMCSVKITATKGILKTSNGIVFFYTDDMSGFIAFKTT